MPTTVPAHIYVIEFSDLTVKVGYTQNADARLATHANEARQRGVCIVRQWISDPHTNATENEARLITFCLEQGGEPSGASREYFPGLDYQSVQQYAQSLPTEKHDGHPVASLLQARQNYFEIVEAAETKGRTTILSRNGRRVAAIVPIDLAPQETAMSINITDLANETGATFEDVLALADQLTTLDGSEAVVTPGAGNYITLTAEAAQTIREQLGKVTTYTRTREDDTDGWGDDVITITERGNQVSETFHVEGVDGAYTSGFSSEDEAAEHIRARGINLEADGYTRV
ncbi:MAG: hypothetical protein JWO11_1646 [Nocardioides sp.]|nr:hypothetical protein [Nocardioides sp.]